MQRFPVSSNSLAEIGYDPDFETLEVQFLHGGVYQYYNVPPFLYERLMAADSLGRFYNAEIKNRFPESKM